MLLNSVEGPASIGNPTASEMAFPATWWLLCWRVGSKERMSSVKYPQKQILKWGFVYKWFTKKVFPGKSWGTEVQFQVPQKLSSVWPHRQTLEYKLRHQVVLIQRKEWGCHTPAPVHHWLRVAPGNKFPGILAFLTSWKVVLQSTRAALQERAKVLQANAHWS